MLWTEEDAARAIKEGWRYRNGYVSRAFDSNGVSLFADTIDVIHFLYEKSKTSDWHREVFLNLPWTSADDQLTNSEGWILNRYVGGSINFRALKRFGSDEEAQRHVQQRATEGDALCIKALRLIAKQRLLSG